MKQSFRKFMRRLDEDSTLGSSPAPGLAFCHERVLLAILSSIFLQGVVVSWLPDAGE